MEYQTVARQLESRPAERRSPAPMPLILDGLRIALFLLVVINVSRVHQSVKLIGAMRPGLLLVFVAGAFAVLNPRRANTGNLFKTTEAKLMLGLFFATCLSAVAGISLGHSAVFLIDRYSKVVIAAFLLLAGIRNVRDLYTLVMAYVVGSGILAYMAIFMFKLAKSRGTDLARLTELYTFDANDIGVVLLVGLPLAILMARHSTGIRKWFSIVVVVAIGLALGRSGSRGALIGLVGTGAVLLVSLKTIPVWKRASFVAVVLTALAVAAPAGYWQQMKTILGLKEDYNWSSTDGRRQLIIRGMGYMMAYPIAGLGIDNFARAECMSDLSDKVRNHVRGTGLKCTPPHNTYVQVGAETGFIGLILWTMLIFGGIQRLRVLRRKIPKAWRLGDAEQRFMFDTTLYLPVAIFGFAITSVFVTFAWLDIIYIAIVYQAGLTYVVRKRLALDLATKPVQVPGATGPVPTASPLPAPWGSPRGSQPIMGSVGPRPAR